MHPKRDSLHDASYRLLDTPASSDARIVPAIARANSAIPRPTALAHRLQFAGHMRELAFASLIALTAACTTSASPDGPAGTRGGKADGETSCPVDASDADAILDAIDNAGSCYVASGIAETCAWGSSLDVQFVSSATALCERGFDAMTTAAKAQYEQLLGECAAKYKDIDGTLYRSMNAYCDLEVTKLFDDLYPEPETTDAKVAFEETCPVDASDPDKIQSAIDKATSCGNAADIASACAWGSSIDTQFAQGAIDKCAAEIGTLSAADQKLHDAVVAACDALYTEGSGTLQLAVAAMCRVQAEVVFDTIATPVE
jgi:hypothetical protein